MKLMNKMLYTVFVFQFIIVIIMAGLHVDWVRKHAKDHYYLNIVNLSQ